MKCPSCWATLEVLPWVVEVVCPYCNTVLLIQKDTIETVWKQSPIVPFPTTFSIWKNFFVIEKDNSNDLLKDMKVIWLSEEDIYKEKINNWLVKVYISWHIRCMNDSWFWEKWFWWVLEDKKWIFDNKEIVIQEDEGLINVFNVVDNLNIDYSKFNEFFNSVGNVIDGYFITESWFCKIDGIEWQFNYPTYWDTIKYVDLKEWRNYYILEKNNDKILILKSI